MLLLSYFFGQSHLYIALLLVSGFTGTFAWIALCWAQINMRKEIIKRGYSVSDLKYQTPYSPIMPIIAIIAMVVFLVFLAFNNQLEYKIAFMIGCLCLIIPMIAYRFLRDPSHKNEYSHSWKYFNQIFPPQHKTSK